MKLSCPVGWTNSCAILGCDVDLKHDLGFNPITGIVDVSFSGILTSRSPTTLMAYNG